MPIHNHHGHSTDVRVLKSSNSEGADCINIKLVKAPIDFLASPFSELCNISSLGNIPDKLKISKVILIFKSDDNTKFTNHRPSSILPCFSKILESAMYCRLINYSVS